MHQIETIKECIQSFAIENQEQLDSFKIQFLSKKSELQQLLTKIKNIPLEERKSFGQKVNDLKQLAQNYYDTHKSKLESRHCLSFEKQDITRPSTCIQRGALHPVSVIMNEVCSIFERIGFEITDGPEIEDDYHVFTALNFPEEHPARDMQDTFFIEIRPDILLRTHTSSIQIRTMENTTPPIRIICPGRVYRNEAISARSHCFFHQVEALYVAKNVSFSEMKQTLLFFAQQMFGTETKIRLRPSYFPFTEPSAEMDISCSICGGKGCPVCKHSGWVEILGCGMVHPNVLKKCNIDTNIYNGYALGIGIERMAMLKYGITDIRLLSENDIRFLSQFTKLSF